jgi:type I restriction enzyme, S subunit
MSKLVATTLGEVTNNYDNVRIPLSVKQRENLAKNFRYYGAQGVIDYVDDYLFDGEYILVAEDGENLKSQKSNICNFVTGKFWVNNHAHIINAANGHDTKYLYYKLSLVNFRNYVTGSAQPKLTKDNLNSIVLHVHREGEQQKIAAVLSALDAKIDCNNRINAELEAMAKTLYDYWFVQFDFPFDFVQGKPAQNGKPYKSSGGKMVYNPTLKREIPVGWKDKRLSQIANITMGQSPPGESLNGSGDGIEFFQGSTDFGWQFPTVRQYTTKPARMATRGDILLSVRAPVGDMNIANLDCCIGRGLAALNSKEGFDGFLFYVMQYFKQIFDRRNSEGTTFGSITKDDLHSLPLAYPPTELLKEYDKIVSRYNQMVFTRSMENQHLTQLRDWLLPMLMNGQVTVT